MLCGIIDEGVGSSLSLWSVILSRPELPWKIQRHVNNRLLQLSLNQRQYTRAYPCMSRLRITELVRYVRILSVKDEIFQRGWLMEMCSKINNNKTLEKGILFYLSYTIPFY